MSANKNNASAIREMTPEELSKTLRSDREELLNLRLRKNTVPVCLFLVKSLRYPNIPCSQDIKMLEM